jgi:hypothetical protein
VRTLPVTATRPPAPTPPSPKLQTQPAATCRSNLAGSFSRLGGLGNDNPIAWRASLRGHCVGMGVLGFAFRLADHGQDCVTIPPNQVKKRNKPGTVRQIVKLSCLFQSSSERRGCQRSRHALAQSVLPIYYTIFNYQETTNNSLNSLTPSQPLDIAGAFSPFF